MKELIIDIIDERIITVLKEEHRSGLGNLILKSNAGEGMKAFLKRLRYLESNKIITIEEPRKFCQSYDIELTEGWK